MKKVFTLVLIAMTIVACQKKDIRPNTDVNLRGCMEDTSPRAQQLILENCSNSGSGTGNVNTLSSDGVITVSGSSPTDSLTGGTITDPLRKKDERDRKGKP